MPLIAFLLSPVWDCVARSRLATQLGAGAGAFFFGPASEQVQLRRRRAASSRGRVATPASERRRDAREGPRHGAVEEEEASKGIKMAGGPSEVSAFIRRESHIPGTSSTSTTGRTVEVAVEASLIALVSMTV